MLYDVYDRRVCVHVYGCVSVSVSERENWLYEWACASLAFAVVCQYATWVGEGSIDQMQSAD